LKVLAWPRAKAAEFFEVNEGASSTVKVKLCWDEPVAFVALMVKL